jgi:choline dehydrogenase
MMASNSATWGGQALDKTFDYIVIGGGTAGLTVASRLSEDPDIHVLVVEAGSDHKDDPLVLTPGLGPSMFGKEEYDWNFQSAPQVRYFHANRTEPAY